MHPCLTPFLPLTFIVSKSPSYYTANLLSYMLLMTLHIFSLIPVLVSKCLHDGPIHSYHMLSEYPGMTCILCPILFIYSITLMSTNELSSPLQCLWKPVCSWRRGLRRILTLFLRHRNSGSRNSPPTQIKSLGTNWGGCYWKED